MRIVSSQAPKRGVHTFDVGGNIGVANDIDTEFLVIGSFLKCG